MAVQSIEIGLNHLADLELYKHQKPYELILPNIPDGIPQSNFKFEQSRVQLHDMRSHENEFTLDTTGFEIFYHEAKSLASFEELDAGDDESVRAVEPYLRELIAAIRNRFGAERVMAIDSRYRENKHFDGFEKTGLQILTKFEDLYQVTEKTKDKSQEPQRVLGNHRAPSSHQVVHLDYSLTSGAERLQGFLTDEEFKTYFNSEYRLRIVNVWRPLHQIIDDAPLAYCDSSTISRDDIVGYDRIMPDRHAENAYLLHRSHHEWYWLSKQTPSEPMLFTVWDSDALLPLNLQSQTYPRLVPHGAFVNPLAKADAAPRRSVEVQLLIVEKAHGISI